MIRTRGAARLFAVSGALFAVACSDAPQPTAPQPTAPQPDAIVPAARAPQSMAVLSAAVPGFGGVYLDQGVPTVYLTDLTQGDVARREVGAYLRQRGIEAGSLRVVQGQYSFAQLDDWFGRVSLEALALPGAVFVDLDEATNRVRIGVEHANAAAAVRGVLARLGVPAGAAIVERADPIHQVATLRDLVRPVVAGLQINFGQFVCSIGFNALSGGPDGPPSFVTASHCTKRQGGNQGTLYYQPLASTAGSFIGTEADDPTYFRGGECPRGKKCRYSDAARVAYATGVSFTLGGIAQTTGVNNGSLTIAGGFTITGDDPSGGVAGDIANKVGRTSGHTAGEITSTCANTGVSGTNIVQLCQNFVSAGVAGGDSGSDVFRVSIGNDVTLLGVLWGGNSAGTLFVFSPFGNVQQELGTLITH